jgi:hypothetical protein
MNGRRPQSIGRSRRRCGRRGRRRLRYAKPLHARAALRTWLIGVAFAVEAEPHVTRARCAVLVVRASAGRACSVEADAPRSAVRIPRALLAAGPGTAIAIARTGDPEANPADATAIVRGTCGLVVAEAAAAGLTFAAAARPLDARRLPAAIAVGRATAGLALVVDASLARGARIARVAPLRLRRFGWLTARVRAGDGDYAGIKPLQVG